MGTEKVNKKDDTQRAIVSTWSIYQTRRHRHRATMPDQFSNVAGNPRFDFPRFPTIFIFEVNH